MANISQYLQAEMLNWVFGGAAVTKPSAWGIGISLGTPNSTSGSECSVSGYARQTVTFRSAANIGSQGQVANINIPTFTFLSACTIKGFAIWDTVLSSNSGNLLAWGTLSASSIMASGSSCSIATGNIQILLD
jgi:hypothetical protein